MRREGEGGMIVGLCFYAFSTIQPFKVQPLIRNNVRQTRIKSQTLVIEISPLAFSFVFSNQYFYIYTTDVIPCKYVFRGLLDSIFDEFMSVYLC